MIRVIKIGGSLLDLADLGQRLNDWCSEQTPAELELLVCGGGKLVDAMRAYDAIHNFESQELHWKCVELLQVSSWLLQSLIDVKVRLDDAEALNSFVSSMGGRAIVTPSAFYNSGDEATCPADWTTTSDSLAAVLARRLQADELVLCKSTGVSNYYQSPDLLTLNQIAETGLVDSAFPDCAAGLTCLRIVNLRC